MFMGQIVIESHSFLEYWQNRLINVIYMFDSMNRKSLVFTCI